MEPSRRLLTKKVHSETIPFFYKTLTKFTQYRNLILITFDQIIMCGINCHGSNLCDIGERSEVYSKETITPINNVIPVVLLLKH